jgi:CheY-like chemotaxis protein
MLDLYNASVDVFVGSGDKAVLQSIADSTTDPDQSKRKAKVLVIDDERFIADTLAKILNTYGYDAAAHYAGQSALDAARLECPDIVLSDVIMPRLNGVETALAIRELCPRVRVFLISGQAGTADLLQEARAEGHDFELLSKPLHPKELLERLASC